MEREKEMRGCRKDRSGHGERLGERDNGRLCEQNIKEEEDGGRTKVGKREKQGD